MPELRKVEYPLDQYLKHNSVRHIRRLDLHSNSLEAKVALGIESDFKYVSIGGMAHYYFISNAGDASYLKNVGALAPVLFITFHDAVTTVSTSNATSQKQ